MCALATERSLVYISSTVRPFASFGRPRPNLLFFSVFPDRVGRVVLDGVVDPYYWANRPAHEVCLPKGLGLAYMLIHDIRCGESNPSLQTKLSLGS